jgi:dTDP-4-amino-4,6-dideoxygalactose transaminase
MGSKDQSTSRAILCANPRAQTDHYRSEIEAAIGRVLASDRYILGPEVANFESEFCSYIGIEHGFGVANGTDALHLALRAIGIERGDEVITVSHTAVATVAAIELAEAVPVLVDVDPKFYTIDPVLVEAAITSRTRAIIAVHLYGQPAAVSELRAIADKHGLKLIEDCAQSHGARLQDRRLGTFGHVACFSFYPTKNLGAIGDGGFVATNDALLAERVMLLRQYGWKERYVSDIAGMNSRLDELQAAILRIKLRHLDQDNARRRELARIYSSALEGAGLKLPAVRNLAEHVFHLYVVQVSARDKILAQLAELGFHCGIHYHYPVPIHLQPAYSGRIKVSLPVTEELARRVLSLPLYPELDADDAKRCANSLRSLLD